MAEFPPTGSAGQRSSDGAEPEALRTYWMFALALAVGAFGGIGSIVFKAIIGFVQNLLFYGQLSFHLEPEAHLLPSAWGWGVIFIPVIGSIIVTWITNTMAPQARGHGVPEVMNAIHHHGGRIQPVTVVAKALASAVSIGSGGSVGREGPIIQIGSAFGSTLGQIWRMPDRQRVVLVSAGAAAGIAATFNAPLGGLAFAMELLLISISAQNVALVAAATITATYIGQLYSGVGAAFEVPDLELFANHAINGLQLLLCVPFGILVGLGATGFIQFLYWMEDQFDERIGNSYLRHMAGMLVLGIMMYAFLRYAGEYYVAGVGYGTILDVLRGILTNPAFLLLLFAGKLLATGLTLGSGASGGVFSPSLFLGAALGAAYGDFFEVAAPSVTIDPVVFAIAGMAGMVGATTSAVVTAIAMIFEQTREYSVILPIITTVALAYIVRSRLTHESIYTLKLARRGEAIPQGLQAAMAGTLTARSVMNEDFHCIDSSEIVKWENERPLGIDSLYTVVTQRGKMIGLAREELPYLVSDQDVESLINKKVAVVGPDTRWSTLMRTLKARGVDALLVSQSQSATDLEGVITHREIANAARDNAQLMD